MFRPDEGMCSIYVYKEFDFFQLPYPPTVTLGTVKDEPMSPKGYLYVNVSPGQHFIQAHNESVEFNCDKEDLIFYAVSNHGFISDPETEIRRISAERGKKEVLDRRLLVTW